MSRLGQDATKLRVFLSYSRADIEFADQLVAILEVLGFEPLIDREGIHGAENWKVRLGQLILESDIVVFVLSPESSTSDVCAWEVEEALNAENRSCRLYADHFKAPHRLNVCGISTTYSSIQTMNFPVPVLAPVLLDFSMR